MLEDRSAITLLLLLHGLFANEASQVSICPSLGQRLLEAPEDGRKLAVSLPQFSFHSGRPPLALSQATRVPEPFMRLRSVSNILGNNACTLRQKRIIYPLS
jgi:hypothetical protein